MISWNSCPGLATIQTVLNDHAPADAFGHLQNNPSFKLDECILWKRLKHLGYVAIYSKIANAIRSRGRRDGELVVFCSDSITRLNRCIGLWNTSADLGNDKLSIKCVTISWRR